MFNLRQLAALVVTTAMGASAFAAGYEKNILWSGKHGGMAGAGAANAMGAEALYFNPAGIGSNEGSQITLNVSPTTSVFSAPVVADNATIDSKREYYLPLGLFYSQNLGEKLAVAAGFYVSGGSKVKYDNLDISGLPSAGLPFTLRPTLKTSIEATEASLGFGYKVSNQLKLGAAYRFAMVNAEFNTGGTNAGNTAFALYELQDLKATQHGFRLGAQYKPSEDARWGMGLMYRSPLNVAAAGNIKATVNTAGGATSTTAENGITVYTVFPTQYSLGGFYDIVPDAWRGHLEVVWTQYSKAKALGLDGTNPTAPGTNMPDIEQAWRDQTNVRLAGEYLQTKYPIRFGYVWTSGVESKEHARANFAAPGVGHTFTVGTGRGNERWDFNIAGEYSVITADGENLAAPNFGARKGEYETSAYAVHTGVTYKF